MPRESGPAPFWICHECHAQMRPTMVDGSPHCASCLGEFIEILDPEINPDPSHELPPAPPVRPGMSPAPSSNRPISPFAAQPQGTSVLESLLGGLFGGGGSSSDDRTHGSPQHDQSGQSDHRNPQSSGGGGGGGSGTGAREWSFQFPGGGQGRIMFSTYNGQSGARPDVPGFTGFPGFLGPFGAMPSPGHAGGPQGLEGFLPGAFPGRPPSREAGLPGHTNRDAQVEGGDLLAVLAQIIQEASAQGTAHRGDYVYDDHSFDTVLEQLMHAAGPQGPIPASDVVIDGLPRKTFDAKSLRDGIFKDCPVCKDDFAEGDEYVTVPCAHIFHTDCIVPWLKRNGSCPVCRFSLVSDASNRPTDGARSTSNESSTQAPSQEEGGQSIFAGVLNRLFGQSGSGNPDTPAGEAPPSTSTAAETARPASAPPGEALSPQQGETWVSAASSDTARMQDGLAPPLVPGRPASTPATQPEPVPQVHSSAQPDVQPMSTAIPAEYRELHRQRELRQQREAEARTRNIQEDDLD